MDWIKPFDPASPAGATTPYDEEEEKRMRDEQEAASALEQVDPDASGYFYLPNGGRVRKSSATGSILQKPDTFKTQAAPSWAGRSAGTAGRGLMAGLNLAGGAMWKLYEVSQRVQEKGYDIIEDIAPSHITPEGKLWESPLKKLARGQKDMVQFRQQVFRDLADEGSKQHREWSKGIGDDTASKAIGTVTTAIPSLFPALATGGLGGGPAIVAGVAGLQSFGQHANTSEQHLTQHYIQLGMSPEDARNVAAYEALGPSLAAGVMTAALVRAVPLGIGAAAKKAGVKAPSAGWGGAESIHMLTKKELQEGAKIGLAQFMGRGAAGEFVEESLDELWQGVVEAKTWNPDKTAEEILNGGLVAGMVGSLLGGGMSGIQLAAFRGSMEVEEGQRTAVDWLDYPNRLVRGDGSPEKGTGTPPALNTHNLKESGGTQTAAVLEEKARGGQPVTPAVAEVTGAAPTTDPAEAVKVTSEEAKSTIEGVLPEGERFKSQPIDGADAAPEAAPIRSDWGRKTAARNLAKRAIDGGVITVDEVNALEDISINSIRGLIESKGRATAVKSVTDPAEPPSGDTSLKRRTQPENRAEELGVEISNLEAFINEAGQKKDLTESQKESLATAKTKLKENKAELTAIESGEQPNSAPVNLRDKGNGAEAQKLAIDNQVKDGELSEDEASTKKSQIDSEADEATQLIDEFLGLKRKFQQGLITQDEYDKAQADVRERFDEANKPAEEKDEQVEEEPESGEDAEESQEGEPEEEVDEGPTTVVFDDGRVAVDTSSVNNNDGDVQIALKVIEDTLAPARQALDSVHKEVAVVLDPTSADPISVNPTGNLDEIIINPHELVRQLELAKSGHHGAARFVVGMDTVFEEELFHLIDIQALRDQWRTEMEEVRNDRRMEFGEWLDEHNKRIYDDMSTAEKTKVLREYVGDKEDPDIQGVSLWESTYKWIVNKPKSDKEKEFSALALRRVDLLHGGMSNLHNLVAGEYVRMRMQAKRGKRRESNEDFYNKENTGLGEWLFMANQLYQTYKERGLEGWVKPSKLVGERINNAIAIIDESGVSGVAAVKSRTKKNVGPAEKSAAMADEADKLLGAKKFNIPSASKRLGPVETQIDVKPHVPYDDPQWNGIIAKERTKGARNSEELVAQLYSEVRDYIGADDSATNRSGFTWDDTQADDAVHWVWSRVVRDAQIFAQKNGSLARFAWSKLRSDHLTGYIRHITSATKEYGGLVSMSAEQAKEADAKVLSLLERIEEIDRQIAVEEEDVLRALALIKENPDADLSDFEEYDSGVERVSALRKERREKVREYYRAEKKAQRQRYGKISLQAEASDTEEDGGITFEEMFGGDVLISGATQNIERSDSNTIVRQRIQQTIDALPTAYGRATAASVRMANVIERLVLDNASKVDIAKELGVSPQTVQSDYDRALPLIAKYIVDNGWASPEKWSFNPAERSGKQGSVRASFDVRVATSTAVRKDSSEAEIRVLDWLQRLFGDERVFLHDDMRFKKVGGALGAKAPRAVAAARLGVSEADFQKELEKPSNPKIAELSDEELTPIANAGVWSHGTDSESQAAIDEGGFRVPKNRLSTVVTGVFMAADSNYAKGYADEGTEAGRYGVNLQKVLNGDAPSVDSDGRVHPAVNEAFNAVARFWADQTGGFSGRFDLAKETARETYARPDITVAQAIEETRFLGDQLMELDEFSEIDQFSSDDTEARVGLNRTLTDKLGYDGLLFTHPDKTHTELVILREPDLSREESFGTSGAITNLKTGQLAAKSPSSTFRQDLGGMLDRIAEGNAYGTVAGWLAIGGEDILLNHPSEKVRALAPLIRQHYDTKQNLEAKLMKGLLEAEEGLTINERDTARDEFHDYIAIREANQNYAKLLGKGSHSKAALEKANEFYKGMSEGGRALVDWVQDTAETTGGINDALDIHVKDGNSWRPIGNLGLLHFPRMLTPKTAELIFSWAEADGITRKPEYAQLLSDMVANGNATTADEAHEMIQSSGISDIASNEFLEGVEMARGIKLPDISSATGEPYYDYSINGYVNFLTRYVDRAAQIQTFGQKRGGAQAQTTAWDFFLGGKDVSGDIKKKILTIKQAVEGERAVSPAANWMLSVAGTGLLGSPLGSLRNFYTGAFFTMEQVGVWEGAKAVGVVTAGYTKALAEAFRDFHKARKKVLEGEGKIWYLTPELRGGEWSMRTPDVVAEATAAGSIQQDIANSMLLDIQDDSVWADEKTAQNKLKKWNRKALFLHSLAERWARATNYVGATQWLRASAKLVGSETGTWKKRLAAMKRMGLTDSDIEGLIEEKSWALEKAARKMVREKQYSYDVTQTPLMFHGMKSPMWKLMFQFQRWGFQRSRDLYQNIALPLIGEERVTWRGKAIGTGKSLSGKPVVRDIGPLIRMLALMVGSGELYGLLREFFKAKDRTELDWKHIWSTAKDSKDIALMRTIERLIMDSATSGALGIASDYAMLTRDLATRGVRYRSPFEPPSFKIARDTMALITNRVQRGWDGLKGEGLGDDIMDYLSKYPTIQQAGVLATRIGATSGLDSVPVLEYAVRDNPHARMGNSYAVQELRNLIRDYSGEMNLNVRYGGQHPLNENSWDYRRIRNSLSAGDLSEALKMKRNLLTEGESKRLQLRALKQSVRQSQPLNAYGVKSDVERKNFVKWLRRRVGSAEATQLLEVQRRYVRTAKQAGLMD